MAAVRNYKESAVSLLLESGTLNFADPGWPEALAASLTPDVYSMHRYLMALHLTVGAMASLDERILDIFLFEPVVVFSLMALYDEGGPVILDDHQPSFFMLWFGHFFGMLLAITIPIPALIIAGLLACPHRIVRTLLFWHLRHR